MAQLYKFMDDRGRLLLSWDLLVDTWTDTDYQMDNGST